MKKRVHSGTILVLLLVLGLVLLGGFGYFIHRSLGESREREVFSRVLVRADELLAAGLDEEAFRLLTEVRRLPPSARSRLSYLKRLREASSRPGRGAGYAEAALRAAEGGPRNPDLTAAAALALLDAGREKDAAALAEKGLSGGEHREVLEEALLRAGLKPSGKNAEDMIFAGLPFSRRGEDFLRASEVSGSADIGLDGALLLLEEGRVAEAAHALSSGPAGKKHPMAAALALHDAGRYAAALESLDLLRPQERLGPEALGLETDLLLRLGHEEKAGEYYRYMLDAYPGFDPAPYINTVYIRRGGNDPDDIPLLRRALRIFPRDPRPLLALGKLLVSRGLHSEAVEILRGNDVFHRDNPDFQLLLLLAKNASPAGGGFAAALWDLRSRSPDYPAVSAVLMGVLFSMADDAGLRQLLASAPGGFEAQTHGALLEVREGNAAAAADAFRRIADAYPDRPEAHFNCGLADSARGGHEKALAAFERAFRTPGADRIPGFLLRCRLRMAEEHIALRRFSQAQRELREILSADPENPEALRKLRKLEGLSQS